MPEPAMVFEDREIPGQWRVERFDQDGGCEVRVFTGLAPASMRSTMPNSGMEPMSRRRWSGTRPLSFSISGK